MIPGSSTFSAICVLDGVESECSTAQYNLEYNYNYSSYDAINIVVNNLLWNGYIIDYDCHTNDGYVALSHKGVYQIDGLNFYVIQVDFYYENGQIKDYSFLGVGINYGGIYYMGQYDDGSYYVKW